MSRHNPPDGLPLFAQAVEVPDAAFDGPEYDPAKDHARLRGQILRVWQAMESGVWRTLGELEEMTGDPQASISAQLRHLRKKKFGSHTIEKRRRGPESDGLWEYRLLPGREK